MTKYKMDKRKKYINLIVIFFTLFFILGGLLASYASSSEENPVVRTRQEIITAIIFLTIALVILFIGSVFMIYAIYDNETYEFDQSSIIYQYKFIVKRKVILPFNKINIINVRRGLLARIFGVSNIRLGSGNKNTAMKAEITLTLEKNKAAQVVEHLEKMVSAAKKGNAVAQNEINKIIEEENNVKIEQIKEKSLLRFPDFIKMTLASSITWLISIFILCGSITLSLTIEDAFSVPAAVILAIIIFILMILSAALISWLIYGNYHIKRTQNRVTITYGLVSIKQININIDRIHGIFINQGILNRFFNFGSISLSVVGLGPINDNNQQNAQQAGSNATILPFSKLTKIMEYLQEFFPELINCSEEHVTKPSKKSKMHYLVIPSCIIIAISLLILLPLTIFITPLFLLIDAPILIFFILNSYLRYRHTSIMVSKNVTYITYGGLYYRRGWCQNHSIQEFRTKAGFIRKKQNLATVHVVLRGLILPISIPHVQAFDYLNASKYI